MTIEQLDTPTRLHNPGRTAAWLAKQVELGLTTVDLSLSQYRILGLLAEGSAMSVSYTHLDVYKRQALARSTTEPKPVAMPQLIRAAADLLRCLWGCLLYTSRCV